MIKGLISISSDDLKKSDKRALATLYLYWLENGKKDVFDLPLFIDDNGKGVMSVESFKRVFYAFIEKCGTKYDCNIKSGDDGDESNYNVVRISKVDDNFVYDWEAPKKTDVKRESSKKSAEKSAEKKAKKEAESKKEADKLADDFAKSHAKKIADLVMGKYGLKLTAEKLTALENDLIAILKM
jgi:hypothetical protein